MRQYANFELKWSKIKVTAPLKTLPEIKHKPLSRASVYKPVHAHQAQHLVRLWKSKHYRWRSEQAMMYYSSEMAV